MFLLHQHVFWHIYVSLCASFLTLQRLSPDGNVLSRCNMFYTCTKCTYGLPKHLKQFMNIIFVLSSVPEMKHSATSLVLAV